MVELVVLDVLRLRWSWLHWLSCFYGGVGCTGWLPLWCSCLYWLAAVMVELAVLVVLLFWWIWLSCCYGGVGCTGCLAVIVELVVIVILLLWWSWLHWLAAVMVELVALVG